MIEWIKYDKENPPSTKVKFLVTNGKSVTSAYLDHREVTGLAWWTTSDALLMGVSHYAVINLPGGTCE